MDELQLQYKTTTKNWYLKQTNIDNPLGEFNQHIPTW